MAYREIVFEGGPLTLERVLGWRGAVAHSAAMPRSDASLHHSARLSRDVAAVEEEFASAAADEVDTKSALIHLDAVEVLRASGVAEPTDVQYAEAAEAAGYAALGVGVEAPDAEGAGLHVKAMRALRTRGVRRPTEAEYLAALEQAEVTS